MFFLYCLLSACSTFEKTAYEHVHEQQVKKDNEFRAVSGPRATEAGKAEYLSYEQYKKEKELVIKEKESSKD